MTETRLSSEVSRPRALIIDSQATLLLGDLQAVLPQIEFCGIGSDADALQWLQQCTDPGAPTPQVILFDPWPVTEQGLDEDGGLHRLSHLRDSHPDIPLLVYSATQETDLIFRAAQAGAFWFVSKTVSYDELEILLTRALEESDRRQQWRRRVAVHALGPLRTRIEGSRERPYHGMIGRSPPMQQLFARTARVAPEECTVWIRGETGTGKELIAQALHKMSRRAGGAFRTINCNHFRGDMLRSELFGHEKGAFTGAVSKKEGIVRQAHGGTLFLDEVGDLDLEAQGTLLRVLEYREIPAVGSTAEPLKVDVRFLCASHKDLREQCREGKMREDFFYRIAEYELLIPALRDRGQDILELARSFLARNYADRSLTPAAEGFLLQQDWRGNIRELESLLRKAAIDHPEAAPLDARDLESVLEPRARPSAPPAPVSNPVAPASVAPHPLVVPTSTGGAAALAPQPELPGPAAAEEVQRQPDDSLRELMLQLMNDEDRNKSYADLTKERGERFAWDFLVFMCKEYRKGKNVADVLGFNYSNLRNWMRNRNFSIRDVLRGEGE